MKAKQVFLERGILKTKLDEFLSKELKRAGYAGVRIVKTALGTRIIIKAARPGLVIGRRGRTARVLTQKIEEMFNLENPQIEIDPLENPDLNAIVMAKRIGSAIQRGVHFRRAAYSALRRIMNAGAKGVEIVISGKLTSQRAKYQKFRSGIIIKAGEPSFRYVEEGKTQVLLKQGVVGVIVRIMKADAELPDEIKVSEEAVERLSKELVEEVGEVEGGREEVEVSPEEASPEFEVEKKEGDEG